MKFDPHYFPKYNQLSYFEKWILKTCCYFPPKKRRERKALIINPLNYQNTLESAYGGEFWELIKGKKVLDFGCGEGGFVIGMATKVNCIAEGVDIQAQFEVAEKHIKNHNIQNTKFHLGSSQNLPDTSYDVIISHDSFEHFEDPDNILNEMTRLLKPNGYLLIKFGPTWMSPYGRHMSGTFKKSRPWIHLIIPEKNMMRVHSVYHNDAILYTEYKDLIGGLNKMTLKRAAKIIKNQENLKLEHIHIMPWYGLTFFLYFPLLKELFGAAVNFKCRRLS